MNKYCQKFNKQCDHIVDGFKCGKLDDTNIRFGVDECPLTIKKRQYNTPEEFYVWANGKKIWWNNWTDGSYAIIDRKINDEQFYAMHYHRWNISRELYEIALYCENIYWEEYKK